MFVTLHERAEHLKFAETDKEYRAAFIAMIRRDRVFFVNTCCWTYDPRIKGDFRFVPMLLFPQQEEFVRGFGQAIDEGEDILLEKSRDTGASWCVMAVLLHGWLFQTNFAALVGSRKEDFVDKTNDPSCLMWKADKLYENLPEWLQVKEYEPKKPHRSHLMMSNPKTGSVIVGESANPNFGRAGRFSVAVCDEGAFWPNLKASYTSAGQSTKCRALVSTPNGMNYFGQLANPKRGVGESVKKFRLHWSLDPRHNKTELDTTPGSPTFGKQVNRWLENEKKRYAYDAEEIARELDINYKASIKGRYYPQIDFSGVGLFPYNPRLPLYTTWDFGIGDYTAIVWVQFDSASLRWRAIDCYQNNGRRIGWYVPLIKGVLPGDMDGEPYNPTDLEVIQRHRFWRYDGHFGDPSGNQRSQTTGTSVIEELSSALIYVTVNTKENNNRDRRRATQRLLLRMDFDEERCVDLVDAIRNSKFPDREDSNQSTAPNDKPVHDEHSHYRTALEFLAINDPYKWELEEREAEETTAGKVGVSWGRSVVQADELDEEDFDSVFGGMRSGGVSVAGY